MRRMVGGVASEQKAVRDFPYRDFWKWRIQGSKMLLNGMRMVNWSFSRVVIQDIQENSNLVLGQLHSKQSQFVCLFSLPKGKSNLAGPCWARAAWLKHAGKHTCTRLSQVKKRKKTQAKGIKIQAKSAKWRNGENLKIMADQDSLQQSSELATGWYYNSVRTARTIGQNTSGSVLHLPSS